MSDGEYTAMKEYEFIEILEKVIGGMLGTDSLVREPLLGRRYRPDLILDHQTGRPVIVEVKGVTPNTQNRLRDVAEQLTKYSKAYQAAYPESKKPEIVLAVPGVLSPEHARFLMDNGVDRIIDGPTVRAAVGQTETQERLRPLAEGQSTQPVGVTDTAASLRERLASINPGRGEWSLYQALCGDILAFLLCPPLELPIGESSNLLRVNRRDFVLPNYATSGFWDYMRSFYDAHYIVVDAKNYVGNIKKTEVLQLANYLTTHGVGLFGVIISRNGEDRSAAIIRREQWLLHRKMIIVLNDDDMRQMLAIRTSDGDPSELIRQKIEDFRLGF